MPTSALEHQVAAGNVEVFNRHEMLDVVIVDGEARGVIVRNLITGEIERHAADAVVLASGGYTNVYYLSTNAMGSNVTATWRAHKRGAFFANPCYTQIHPTCIPQSGEYQSKLTLMSESLRNDGRIWVPRKPATTGPRPRSPTPSVTTSSRSATRPSATSPRATSPRAPPRSSATTDSGSAAPAAASTSISATRSPSQGKDAIERKYGNLFEMYEPDHRRQPVRDADDDLPGPALRDGRTLGRLRTPDHDPGLFAIGEANFSDHGANRLGASALMQCLADGYFVAPHTVTNHLAKKRRPGQHLRLGFRRRSKARSRATSQKLIDVGGSTSAQDFHREMGHVMLDKCGMSRTAEGLDEALAEVRRIKAEFWSDLRVDPG